MNTEIIEQEAHRILTEFGVKSISENINAHLVKGLMVLMANWQKEQDETKYKALLDSHNELLETSKKAVDIFKKMADEGNYPTFMLSVNGGEGFKFITNAINKAKNI